MIVFTNVYRKFNLMQEINNQNNAICLAHNANLNNNLKFIINESQKSSKIRVNGFIYSLLSINGIVGAYLLHSILLHIISFLFLIFGIFKIISGYSGINSYHLFITEYDEVCLIKTALLGIDSSEYDTHFDNYSLIKISDYKCPICNADIDVKFSQGKCPNCNSGKIILPLFNINNLEEELIEHGISIE